MLWKNPPKIKIYEALGAISDDRILLDGCMTTVISSAGNKQYQVQYDPDTNRITANDNGSYYQKYLGYPAIAFLLAKQIISHNTKVLPWLHNIPWKDINTKHKNDFQKTEDEVRGIVVKRGGNLLTLDQAINDITYAIPQLDLETLKSDLKPPEE